MKETMRMYEITEQDKALVMDNLRGNDYEIHSQDLVDANNIMVKRIDEQRTQPGDVVYSFSKVGHIMGDRVTVHSDTEDGRTLCELLDLIVLISKIKC